MRMIFVSSTFKDMHYERDIIHERVTPELNEYALQFGEGVTFCDLRWGVNTGDLENEEGSKKVLSVCLDEIDKCRPYMIIIIGERYGWIPDQSLISEALENRSNVVLDELEMSVTALEIEYGALCHPDKMQQTLIYFREFEGEIPENYRKEGDTHARKLEKLKARVRKLTGGNVKTYKVRWDEDAKKLQGIDEFAAMVSADVKNLLTKEWNEYQQLNPYEKDQRIQWEYASQKAKQFSARDSYVNEYVKKLESGQNIMIVKGVSGCGKSTLMSRLALELQNNREVCLLFAGNTFRSSNVLDVIKSMVYFTETKLSWPHMEAEIQPKEKEQKIEQESLKGGSEGLLWADRLNEVITAYEQQGERKIVFMLDAADQLYADELREKRYYIPSNLNEKVQMVISCLDDYVLPYEEEVQWILPLSEQDKREIIKGITGYIGRELEQCVVEKIVKKQSSDNPLYLSMLIQRLVMMNKRDFDDIVAHGDGMSAISQHQMKLVEDASEMLQGVGVDILTAASERVGGCFVQKAVMYIALSRYGLREKDLEEILTAEGLPWNTLDFSVFVKYMRSLFVVREDGRLDFAHKNIRKGYQAICEDPQKMHHQIMKYLDTLDEKDMVRNNEIIYHCIKSDDKEYFIQYLERYEKTETIAVPAAAVVRQLTLEDDGSWILQVMKEEKAESAHTAMLNFLNYELDDAFDVTQKELQIELAMYRQMIPIAESLCCGADMKRYRRLALAYKNNADLYDYLDDYDSREMSRSYYRAALETRKKIRTYEETNWRDLRQLANAYDDLGDSYAYEEDQKSLETGRTLYLEAHKIRKELLEQEQSILNRANLAKSYKKLGTVYSYFDTAQNDLQALSYYNQAEEVYEQLVLEKASYRENLASVYRAKGLVYENMGKKEDLENALIFYQKNLHIRERLNMEHGSAASRVNLATAYGDIADFMLEYGSASEMQQAEHLYKKILEIDILLHKERNTASSYSSLAAGYYDLGNCYMTLGGDLNQQKALEMFQSALAIREELVQTQKTDSSLMNLIRVRKKMAYLLAGTGKQEDRKQAVCFVRQNLEDRKRLAENLKTMKSQISLATAYLNYTRIIHQDGNSEEVKPILKKAIHIYESYSEEELTSVDIQNYSCCNQDLANQYTQDGTKESLQQALFYAQKSDRICEYFYEKSKSNDSIMMLASSYEKTAYVYNYLGDKICSEQFMDRAIVLQEQLVNQCTNKSNQNNLLIYYLDYCILFRDSPETAVLRKVDQVMDKALSLGERVTSDLGTLDSIKMLAQIYRQKWSIEISRDSYDEKAASYTWLVKWQEAVDRMQEFTDINQDLEEQRYRLYWSYGDYYRVLSGKENLKKSLQYYKCCEGLIRKCDDLISQKRLAEYYYVLAQNSRDIGGAENIQAAEQYLEEYLKIKREIYDTTKLPLDLKALRTALSRTANYCWHESNQLERAVLLYEESIRLGMDSLVKDPSMENKTSLIIDRLGLMDCYNAYMDKSLCEKNLYLAQLTEELFLEIEEDENDTIQDLKAKLLERKVITYQIMKDKEAIPKAISCCQEMITIFDYLYEKQKTPNSLESLSNSYEKLGTLYLSLEDNASVEQARQAYDVYFEMTEKLWKELQTHHTYRNLAVAYEKKASIWRAYSGDEHYMTALDLYKKALAIWEELYEMDQNFDALDGIAIICHHVGEMYQWISETGHEQMALQYFEREATIREKLVTLHPSEKYREYLLTAYEKIGDVYKDLDGSENEEKALQIYENLLKERKKLHERIQSTTTYRSIAIAYERLGDIYYNMSKEDEGYQSAKQYFEHALQIWKDIREQITGVDYFRGIYNVTKRIGNCCYYHSNGALKAEAAAHYGQMAEACENLVREVGTDLWVLRLAQAYSRLGIAHEARVDGNYKSHAKDIYLVADEWYDKIQMPSHIKEGTDLRSTTLFKLAGIYLAEGTEESQSLAKQYFEKGIQVWKKHPEECSSSNGRYNLAAALLQLGSLCGNDQEEERQKEAIEYLEESSELFEVLCAESNAVNKLDNYWMCLYLLAKNEYYEKKKILLIQKMFSIAEELFERTGSDRHKGFVDFCKYVLDID